MNIHYTIPPPKLQVCLPWANITLIFKSQRKRRRWKLLNEGEANGKFCGCSSTKFIVGQTGTLYKILAGLQDNSCLQETNILIGKTPKNIRQNQICFKRAIYKVLCVGVWKRNFFSDSLANSWKEFLIVNVTSVLIYSVRTLDTCLPKLMFIRTEYLKTFRSVS